MINEIKYHPVPKVDARGEEILLSIHKFATILGDHVANTDIHVQSLITDEEIDDLVQIVEGDNDAYSFLDDYYTKDDIDNAGFLKEIPNYYITDDELKLYIDGIETEVETAVTKTIKESADLSNYYTKSDIAGMLTDYATQAWVISKLGSYYTKDEVDSKISSSSSNVKVTAYYTEGTGNNKIATIGTVDIYAPAGSSTGGSDGNNYVKSAYLTTAYHLILERNGLTNLDVDLSSLSGGSSSSSGSGSTTYKSYYNISVYKAVSKNTDSVDKPGSDYNVNTSGEITKYPSGWTASPSAAIEDYGSTSCDVWVSHNNVCSDGTSTGWTTPVKYYNIDKILTDAKTQAQEYYNQQLSDTASDINKIKTDAQSTLDTCQDILDKIEAGEIDQVSLQIQISTLKDAMLTTGWNYDDTSVTFMSSVFSAIDKQIYNSVSSAGTDGTGLVDGTLTKSFWKMQQDVITLQSYDLDKLGNIDSGFINVTPANLLLEVLSGSTANTNVQSAVIDIVKSKITMSVAKGDNNSGVSLSLGFDADNNGVIDADAKTFTITGEVIADALNANSLTITKGAASISGDGSAYFGKSTSKFNADGSGSVASGNIQWETDGTLTVNADGTFTGDVKASSFEVINNGSTAIKMSLWTSKEAANNPDANIPVGTPVIRAYYNGEWYYTNLTQLSTGDSVSTISFYKYNNTTTTVSGSIKLSELNGNLNTNNLWQMYKYKSQYYSNKNHASLVSDGYYISRIYTSTATASDIRDDSSIIVNNHIITTFVKMVGGYNQGTVTLLIENTRSNGTLYAVVKNDDTVGNYNIEISDDYTIDRAWNEVY